VNNHPYLRAYLAGIGVPTLFLVVIVTAFTAIHTAVPIPVSVERAIVFPMAVVPNLWGLWNLLYRALSMKRWISLGAFGGLLPLVLMPAGFALGSVLGVPWLSIRGAVLALPVAIIIYYLAWKYLVGFLNRVVSIGDRQS
jgi:hypothetical protein